jgi:hypothetical protein
VRINRISRTYSYVLRGLKISWQIGIGSKFLKPYFFKTGLLRDRNLTTFCFNLVDLFHCLPIMYTGNKMTEAILENNINSE